jgi:hypothetical protein
LQIERQRKGEEERLAVVLPFNMQCAICNLQFPAWTKQTGGPSFGGSPALLS